MNKVTITASKISFNKAHNQLVMIVPIDHALEPTIQKAFGTTFDDRTIYRMQLDPPLVIDLAVQEKKL